MDRKNISSGSPYEKKIGFSRAVRMGNQIWVSGTAPVKADGKAAHPGDLYKQTNYCLNRMLSSIEAAGGELSHIVRTRIYLKSRENWEEAARAHHKVFKDVRPTCTFVVVRGFIDPLWLVETEAECLV